ncbi:MAG: biotin-dependent carboxyltransferase family protein [Clostridia bacterium]|nr:biotin-dependent carboxyltransferase family protein [Oscillospiraceae bacterium]MBQ7033115.1 biotin-dependent carboxyltransferase family protein [Clostridia bacterium]
MKMTVLSPGPLSTVQDEGRFGFMSTGFSPGGAMDTYSMRIANILVGNAPGDGVIEMTMLGMSVSFSCTAVIALTGADMEPAINGTPVAMYTAAEVHAGDILSMKMARSGMRSYLAVAGGFDLPYAMGSMSTNLKCGLGGFSGRKLQSGDEIPLRQSFSLAHLGNRKTEPENVYPDGIGIRVILGPQEDYFTDKGIETFLNTTYTVSEKSDRMGVRLDGDSIENKNGVDILSDGIATGAVQIPASGTPIIMMADRQTTGGYAKIANVISADLPKMAQARPGTRIRFTAVTEKEAVRLKKQQEQKLKALAYMSVFAKQRG